MSDDRTPAEKARDWKRVLDDIAESFASQTAEGSIVERLVNRVVRSLSGSA